MAAVSAVLQHTKTDVRRKKANIAKAKRSAQTFFLKKAQKYFVISRKRNEACDTKAKSSQTPIDEKMVPRLLTKKIHRTKIL